MVIRFCKSNIKKLTNVKKEPVSKKPALSVNSYGPITFSMDNKFMLSLSRSVGSNWQLAAGVFSMG